MSSQAALIKLGRLVTPAAMDEIRGGKDGDAFYVRGGLRLLHPAGVPLVCDHDMSRKVGTVHELFEADDVDGGAVRPWLWARATVAPRARMVEARNQMFVWLCPGSPQRGFRLDAQRDRGGSLDPLGREHAL